jgi:hypothetical protein
VVSARVDDPGGLIGLALRGTTDVYFEGQVQDGSQRENAPDPGQGMNQTTKGGKRELEHCPADHILEREWHGVSKLSITARTRASVPDGGVVKTGQALWGRGGRQGGEGITEIW